MSFIKAPRADELKVYNEKYGFNCSEEELASYSGNYVFFLVCITIGNRY